MAALRRSGGARQQPSTAMCYVAEITSGKLGAYAIPWSPPMYAAGQPQTGSLYLVGATHFRQPEGATGRGAGGSRGREKERDKEKEKEQ